MKKSILNLTNTIITIVMLAFTSSNAALQAQNCNISVISDPTTGIAKATLSGSGWCPALAGFIDITKRGVDAVNKAEEKINEKKDKSLVPGV
jgi:hypothetical protein